MKKKKILVVYPNNFLQGRQGTNNRVFQLISAFKELNFEIDLLGYENFTADSSFENFKSQNKDGLINDLFIYDFKKDPKRMNYKFLNKLKKVFNRSNSETLHDWTNEGSKKLFDEITTKNNYDIVILFYSYLANFLTNKNVNYKKIYFMEDSMFLQQYSLDRSNKKITLGKLMDEEINRLKKFDDIFSISYDEKNLYEKLLEKKIHFLPHLSNKTIKNELIPVNQRKWDIFYIGFNNPFNIEGLNWFLENVYPHLPSNLRILLVGSVTDKIEVSYSNVDIIQFVPDLNDVLQNVKISICPMFRGTGMKIKVVDSMEYGLPVVCNERGVDGLPDKTESGCLVTEDPIEFANYICKLLNDQEYYAHISNKTKYYYEKNFNKENYKKKLEMKLT